ncbi:MAG: dihydrodipicolinate synthase family protein [Alphaproteobacteria bacterium]|nr:dihydrodipicolinate synthase family protein [Alphaproteobacteria bacterium]
MTHLLDATAQGVYPIVPTPFTERGDIDWPSVDRMIEFYLRGKVHGLTLLGIMGEAQKLSDGESAELVRHAMRAVAGRVPVVVGVSNAGTSNLVALSRVAMEAGACGVMIAPFIGLKTEAQIAAYFGEVVAALGPEVPICYQDYPQSSQAFISPGGFVRLVDAHPSIVMFKHEDCPGLKKLTAVRKACDGAAHRRIAIFVGNGGLYVPQEMHRGADGMMTGFAFPEVLVEVFDLFRKGDAGAAEDLFDLYLPILRHEQQPGFGLPVRKEILRRRGAIASAAVRAPGGKLDADDIAELDRLLARLEARTGATRERMARRA